MKRFFTKNGIALLTAVTVVTVLLCVLSALSNGTGFLHNALGVVASPFRAAGGAVSGWVENVSDHFAEVDHLQDENSELRKKVADLERQVREGQKDSEENQRLRKLLNLRQQRSDFVFEASSIVGRSTSNWESTMTLDKGTNCDIAIGDCVVNEEGFLAGVVTEVGLNWATVTSILDTNSQLGATVFRTGENTVAVGDLGLMDEGKLKLSYLEDESSLVNGDLILTSGLGGHYPSNLVIGSVEDIRTDDNGLTKYGVLVPQVDLDTLTQVFVITDFKVIS